MPSEIPVSVRACLIRVGDVEQVNFAAGLDSTLTNIWSFRYELPRRLRAFRRLRQEVAQFAAATWVAEFAQRLGLDLADALAGDVEGLPDLFQRVRASILAGRSAFPGLRARAVPSSPRMVCSCSLSICIDVASIGPGRFSSSMKSESSLLSSLPTGLSRDIGSCEMLMMRRTLVIARRILRSSCGGSGAFRFACRRGWRRHPSVSMTSISSASSSSVGSRPNSCIILR